MLGKIFIIFVVFAVFCLGIFIFIDNEIYIDFVNNNPEAVWAPKLLYHVGNFFVFIQNYPRADGVYLIVLEAYKESDYFGPVYYRYFVSAANRGKHGLAVKRGNGYLAVFPEGKYANEIREKVDIFTSFMGSAR